MHGIYYIKNKINNKIYIGSAVDIKHRWQLHIKQLKNNQHHSKHLQRSWNKYGEDAFLFGVIEKCSKDVLLIKEQYYIDFYKSYKRDKGYNMSPTAGSTLGLKHSEETRKKMSLAKQNMSKETKQKISEASKKRDISTYKNSIEAMIKSNKERKYKTGYKLSKKHKKNISSGGIGKHIGEKSGTAKLTEKDVIEIKELLKENKLLIREIAKLYGVSHSTISDIKHNRTWTYLNSKIA